MHAIISSERMSEVVTHCTFFLQSNLNTRKHCDSEVLATASFPARTYLFTLFPEMEQLGNKRISPGEVMFPVVLKV